MSVDDGDLSGNIRLILHRLDQLELTLEKIHLEVRKTNGRVTELEKIEARSQGAEQAEMVAREAAEATKRTERTVFLTAVAGGTLAVISWFVGHSLNG